MFYRTRIKATGAGYATDISGKRLTFIGNYPCKAGDFVWTDGNVIFGNTAPKPQPVIFDSVEDSGIPVLTDNLRGYYRSGVFKKYNIAKNINDLSYEDVWVINNKKEFFYNFFPSIQDARPYEDIEISDNNVVFAVNRNSIYADERISTYFNIFSINGYPDYSFNPDYIFSQKIEDFKIDSGDDENEEIELLFVKLLKGDDNQPVKWFAAFKTVKVTSEQKRLPDSRKYYFQQNNECLQELTLHQKSIWQCTCNVSYEDIPHYATWNTFHEEIFTVDSDGNKAVFYESNSSGFDRTIYPIQSEEIETVEIERTASANGDWLQNGGWTMNNFTGIATFQWTVYDDTFDPEAIGYTGPRGIGISAAYFKGIQYKVTTKQIPVDSEGTFDEEKLPFTYPVQDGFYISADDIQSPLKLFDADDNLVLDFATSGDSFLAELTGFYNFAAILTKQGANVSDNEYLLTIHDWHARIYWSEKNYLWKIKGGTAIQLSRHCYNYRFSKMKKISKARK